MNFTQHGHLPVTLATGGVATVTMDRPEVHNALDLSMWAGLRDTFRALSADNDLRCVIIRGAGERAFSAGADIGSFAAERSTRAMEDAYAPVFHDGMQSIRLCQHPVVAAISGICMGGGAGIATMCDFRVGGEGIRFAITANRMGLFYPYAEIDPLIAAFGTGVAAEILIEGRVFSGRDAYDKGILSRVVPDAAVFSEAQALSERVAAGAPLAARFHKAAIRKLRGPLPVTAGEDAAVNAFVETEDFAAARTAFIAKGKPVFRGR